MKQLRLKKSIELLTLIFGTFLILLTIAFIIDIQFKLGVTTHHVCSNCTYDILNETTYDENMKLIFKSSQAKKNTSHDYFVDLEDYVMNNRHTEVIFESEFGEDRFNPTIAQVLNMSPRENATIFELFSLNIKKRELYGENDDLVDQIIDKLIHLPIQSVEQKSGGTQLKLIAYFDDRIKALVKPMRNPRNFQTLPNHFYFNDYERHNAEIAAFNLDRILGFRRAMPITGRIVNVRSELFLLAEDHLARTFFRSPAYNLCFFGECSQYCDSSHAICGNPELLETSFAAYLPMHQKVTRASWRHPWRRSYSKYRKAKWETDRNYCEKVQSRTPYNKPRRMLDLMDMAIFDFLIGNMDRHHYETFELFGNDTFTLHLDHGRSFGRPYEDEISCLVPLLQCCMIRQTTLQRLLDLHNGPDTLSEMMRAVLSADPISPVLWEPHLEALDRRVGIILRAVRNCIRRNAVF